MGICCTINTRGRYLSAKSIAVVNQKGGVGKTTTAVNVAAGLALAGRPTLLIDLDPQGNATTGLGVQKSGLYPTIYHVLLGAESLEKAVRGSELLDLRLVPSDIDLVGAEIELQIRDEVHRSFPGEIFETVIPRNIRLTEAPSHGKPVMLHDLRSSGAIAYLDLTREVIRHE